VIFDPVAVVPVYDHPATIGAVTRQILSHGLRCILVDDGSSPECARVLDRLVAGHSTRVGLVRLPVNRGKGAAMVAGFRAAGARGHTHVLQIDADGQHATGDIPLFLEQARRRPEAVIAGCPVYDESVPRGRLYGRYATHVWVWINTLSFDIRDSMCGFRMYPLDSLLPLLDAASIGRRMDFDSDVIVRLHWRGVPVLNQPTRVTYPQDGVSHFRMLRDNVRISLMHARLFAGMLLRSPLLLWRKVAA
jgi:glycosyltransferase involved in cell wall biosynthesis